MSARDNIFAKLNKAQRPTMTEPMVAEYYAHATPKWENDVERLKHWARTMRKFKTEIYWTSPDNWTDHLCGIMHAKQVERLLIPSKTAHGQIAQSKLSQKCPHIQFSHFDSPIEDWKDELFDQVQAGFTDVLAGIAQTGTLIIEPTPDQPRSMSLVPPVHIALFDTSRMYDDFYSAMHGLHMAEKMPSNLVLVSSPSKTSDIQLTLAFGAHGPRDLVVLAVLPAHISIEDVREDV